MTSHTHTHSFASFPFDDPVSTAAFCTDAVARRRLYAQKVTHDRNGDWQFLDGSDEPLGEPVLVCMGCVFEHDPTLAEIAKLPRGWSAWRDEHGGPWERWEREQDENDDEEDESAHACDVEEMERKALADIAEHGLHILHVREREDSPPFTYSIGVKKSLGMPELIMVGLRPEVAHAAINECYRQMKAGEPIGPGARVKDLLGGGFECVLVEVPPEAMREYMRWNLWLYDGADFRAWQIVYPTTSGVFPWEPHVPEGFLWWQPLLGSAPQDRTA